MQNTIVSMISPRAEASPDLVLIEPVYALHVPPPLLDPSLSNVLEYTQDADHIDDGSARSIYRVWDDTSLASGRVIGTLALQPVLLEASKVDG